MPRPIDPLILEAALVGLKAQRQRIDQQIALVKGALRGRALKAVSSAANPGYKRRVLSAAARKRIAAAQRKR